MLPIFVKITALINLFGTKFLDNLGPMIANMNSKFPNFIRGDK